MAAVYEYVDPLFLQRFTYIDELGKRRVKNPYRNMHTYVVITGKTNDTDSYTYQIPEQIQGKVVTANFPAGVIFAYQVSHDFNSITFHEIPDLTLVEINVINPKPIKPSKKDLLWDELPWESQKSLMAAWGDIDLICNQTSSSTVGAEWGFDDQNNFIKWQLISEKNNCNNLRWGVHDYLNVPPNDVWIPPVQEHDDPKPVPPPDPEPGPIPPGESVDIVVCPREIIEVGEVEILSGNTEDLVITMEFSVINASFYPDLNVEAPNGDKVGYNWTYLSQQNSCTVNTAASCDEGRYTGYNAHPEIMRFVKPISGKWKFYAQSWGGHLPSRVRFSCSHGFVLTYPLGHICPGFPEPPGFTD